MLWYTIRSLGQPVGNVGQGLDAPRRPTQGTRISVFRIAAIALTVPSGMPISWGEVCVCKLGITIIMRFHATILCHSLSAAIAFMIPSGMPDSWGEVCLCKVRFDRSCPGTDGRGSLRAR